MSANGPGIAIDRRPGAAADGSIPGPAATALALSVGAAVPAAVFGKAVMGVVLAPAVLVVLFALSRGEIRRATIRVAAGPAGLAFGLFGLVALASALLSQDVAKSLETWARTVAFVVFGVVSTQLLARDRRALALAKRSLVVATVVSLCHVVFAIHVSADLLALIKRGSEIVEPLGVYFKGFGSAVACLLPVVLWSAAGAGLAGKALRLGILVLAVLSIWLDGDQASLAGALGIAAMLAMLATVALLGRVGEKRRTAAAVALGTVVVGLVLVLTAALPAPRETDPTRLTIPTWLLDRHRQVIWAFTLEVTERRPVLGHGPNTINFVEGADLQIVETGQDFLPSHPHNWFYEILSETGIVGLVALCAALVLLLRTISVCALRGSRAGWAGVGLFGAFWGSSLVNFSIWAAWWQLTFVVLMAIVMASARPTSAPPKVPSG